MNTKNENRRKFLRNSVQSAAGLMMVPLVGQAADISPEKIIAPKITPTYAAPRIKFAAIGMNHGHIYGMVNAVERGGGEFVAYYAKEPELMADFKKRFPKVKARRQRAGNFE